MRATLRVRRGEWRAAEADARESLAMGEQFGVSQCPSLLVLGRLAARRGDPSAGATLDEAWERAVETQELQRLAPAAAARAEHAWLDGDLEATVAIARPAYELAARLGDVWARAELAYWLWRGGAPAPPREDDPVPYAAAIAGDWRAAAAAWADIGYPYERAEALSEADDEQARLEALTTFDAFGAERAALRLRRRLRADGVRRIPRGPRAASKAGPAGLTPRETEVLDLIVRGATNVEIAQALVIAPKTVDHHVSAVLGKLGVSSRRDAGAALERLGALAAGADGQQVLHLEAGLGLGADVPLAAEVVQRRVELLGAPVAGGVGADADRRAVAGLEVLAVGQRVLEGGDLERLALHRAPVARGRRTARSGGSRSPTAAAATRRRAAPARTGPSCGTARRACPRASS